MARRPSYRVYSGSLHEKFGHSRAKVQLFGGGFGNGKTAAAVVQKLLPIARDYHGANILVARETFPKLNDTIRAEFLKWCPSHWIKSFPMSANGSNTCTLINGTKINFRYIQQQGKTNESSTSNLLSATYDLIIVDQIEDPGISRKDFDDLFGRLRGNALYMGNDPSMPRTGPRWFVPLCNPTRNWVYKTIVKPVHDYMNTGHISEYLLCKREPKTKKPLLGEDGKPQLLIEIFEGSTYENKENLAPDFIETLEATYHGQMYTRFLLGEWGAYEGLVYPQFDESMHMVSNDKMQKYLDLLTEMGYMIKWIAGYDYGIAVPSCFLLAFTDPNGNVIVIDGFYKKEMSVADQRKKIASLCRKYGVNYKRATRAQGKRLQPYADPSIFKRGPGGAKVVGASVARMFEDNSRDEYGAVLPKISMQRGNNAILNGITKVQQYLQPSAMHRNPFTGNYGAPRIYFAQHLHFIADEANDYIWKPAAANSVDEKSDEPRDGNDHAMDTTKYLLSHAPAISVMPEVPIVRGIPDQWHEEPDRMRA